MPITPFVLIVSIFIPILLSIVLYMLKKRSREEDNAKCFNGAAVIVTGASEGMGRELCIHLSRYKACVLACARNKMRLESLHEECGCDVLVADAGLETDCKSIIDTAIELYGGIDVLFINHAKVMYGLISDCKDVSSEAAAFINTNYLSAVRLAHNALPYLMESKGRIVVSSSMSAWLPVPLTSFYAASKSAINTYFAVLRQELGDCGVSVSLLAIGAVGTDNAIKNTKGETAAEWSDVNKSVREIVEGVVERREIVRVAMSSVQFIAAKLLTAIVPQLMSKIMVKLMGKSIENVKGKKWQLQ